ncbi:MAG: hypothetical protein NXI22_03760 [bacterium]|nr:hypothetical protein [bacterium]
MGEKQETSDLDQLLARLVDGDATAADIAALEGLLDGNPDAQRRYVHYLDLHQELLAKEDDECHGVRRAADENISERWSSKSVESGLPTASEGHRTTSAVKPIPRTQVVLLLALAAALLVAVGLGIGRWMNLQADDDQIAHQSEDIPISVPTAEESDDGVAVLTRAVDAEWLSDNPPQTGSILSPGELKLAAGVIQVEFYSGVQLLVEGPADLEIRSVASVICREGKLRSFVPPNATGFSVLTPKFELVDLGTEFAVDVASDGRSDVHVFDGEVELYLPDGKRKPDNRQVLLGGDAMGWSTEGKKTPREATPEAFTSFEAIRHQEKMASDQRFENWQKWSHSLRDDSRLVARYDFQTNGTTLIDSSATKAHGTIIGCEWTSGRWPEKQALEFKRPGDRVRIDVPGEFDSLTISAWVRVDALPSRRQSLLLTDGYEMSRLHWQIGPEGELRIGSRGLSTTRHSKGYASPPLITSRRVGVWNLVCSTYDQTTRTVTHWFNGNEVFTKSLEVDRPIRIGAAEIGNWGIPLKPERRAIRNFIGRIDELTIWNTALGKDEIKDLYHSSRP